MSFVHTVIAFATSYIFCGTEQNDVDSIIIEEFAYYCFFSHFFYTPYSSDLFAFAKLRIVIRFISFQNCFIKNKKRVYHSFHN